MPAEGAVCPIPALTSEPIIAKYTTIQITMTHSQNHQNSARDERPENSAYLLSGRSAQAIGDRSFISIPPGVTFAMLTD